MQVSMFADAPLLLLENTNQKHTWEATGTNRTQKVNCLCVCTNSMLSILHLKICMHTVFSSAEFWTHVCRSEGTALSQTGGQSLSIRGRKIQDHSRRSALHQTLHSGPAQTRRTAGHQSNHTLHNTDTHTRHERWEQDRKQGTHAHKKRVTEKNRLNRRLNYLLEFYNADATNLSKDI